MKRPVWFIVCMCLPVTVSAQHLFEAGLRGGLAAWSARTDYVSARPNLHAGLDVAYVYHSPHVIGFRAGLTVDYHQTAFAKTDYTDSYRTIDVDNQRMQIDYTVGSLRESYRFWSVGVPVQIALSWRNISFSIGPKFVFPLSSSWTENADHASLSVYYPDYDSRVLDSYPLAASQDFSAQNEGVLTMPKIQYWLASELTYTFQLNSYSTRLSTFMVVGLYFDYSFSGLSIDHNKAESLVTLTDTRDGFPLQRVLSPVLTSSRQGEHLVSRCALFDIGIKLSVALAPYNPHRPTVRRCNCL